MPSMSQQAARMPRSHASVSDVISDFVSYYIDSVLSGRCRDDQYGLAFMLAKSGYMFVAVDPDPAVDANPTSLAPRELFPILAHAVFKPHLGRISFTAPVPTDGSAPGQYEMLNPVYIHFEQNNQSQLWMLSLNRLQEDGEPIMVHRADPATITVQRIAEPKAIASALGTLH